MTQTAIRIRTSDANLEIGGARNSLPGFAARRIIFRSAGRRRGPITRLVSPSDLGELIKPFVFLDHAEVAFTGESFAGIHPHSGIATLTTVLQGGLAYEDTTGKEGQVRQGGLEWMKAGKGVWHDGGPLEGDPLRVFQLWIALPEQEELGSPESQYIPADAVEEDGPVRVILGQYGAARSRISAPEGINYFHVRRKDGERWVYTPPRDHKVAWLAVDEGRLIASEAVGNGEVAVFEESNGPIELRAEGAASFVIGSAIKHPYPLVLGYYSVHTSAAALARGEAEIKRIGSRLSAAGRL